MPTRHESSRTVSRPGWTVAAWTSLALLQGGVTLAQSPQTFFLPSNFAGRAGVMAVSGPTRAGHPLCRTELRGLDLARRAIGSSGCEPAPSDRPSLEGRIDTVILIDDTHGIPSALVDMIPARLRSGTGSGSRVLPGAIYGQTSDGRHVRRTLIVGAAEFRSAASEAAWMTRIRSAARELDRGTRDADEMAPQDIEVTYHRDFGAFQRAVEDVLCPVMMCGSDGRGRMRELIGRHEDLRNVHRSMSSVPEGRQVAVRAFLYRQTDRDNRIIDLRFDLSGQRVTMDDETIGGRGPDAAPLVEQVEGDMIDSAGPRPPSAMGDERYAVALPYMAYLDGYGVTMSWLTQQGSSTPMDSQLLPTRRPMHQLGCGAPPLHTRNRAGCEDALERWRGMEVAERRLLRIPENRQRLLRRLLDRYCEAFDHLCDGCTCDTPVWAH